MADPLPRELWLEPVLERHLVQVTAPDELWNRIRRPAQAISAPTPSRVLPRKSLSLALAATALAAVAAWSLVASHDEPPGGTLAIEALSRETDDLELRSGVASEIRTWVKTKTGLDLPLPTTTSPAVLVSGVCGMRGDASGVEVAYRVRGHKAALIVSRATRDARADGKHRFLRCDSTSGVRVSTWTMRGQLYTLAYASPGDSRDECLLCHAGPPALALSN